MSIKSISNALDSRLALLPSSPSVAWVNTPFSPVVGQVYLRPTNLLATSALSTLQHNEEQRGIYQVDIFAPLNQGRGVAEGWADSIVTLFSGVRVLTSGAVSVRIGAINISPPTTIDSWVIMSVSVNYVVHLQR